MDLAISRQIAASKSCIYFVLESRTDALRSKGSADYRNKHHLMKLYTDRLWLSLYLSTLNKHTLHIPIIAKDQQLLQDILL